MAYKLEIAPSAQRQIRRLDTPIRKRIAKAIDGLAAEPRPPDVKKLTAEDDLWRIRVGDYRIIYQIMDRRLTVLVVEVGHRGDIYR